MSAVKAHPHLELQLVVGASALLDKYGSAVEFIEQDGFVPLARVHMLVEGETPATMAKSTGLGLLELPSIFEAIKPDVVLTVGDRFETMATAIAAAYMNIPLAHTMGGEISGNIDGSIRHAVTKFAHIHFPASREAYKQIVRLGEDPERVHFVGCPRIDEVDKILKSPYAYKWIGEALFRDGVGHPVDPNKKFILVSQHPVTTEYGNGKAQILKTLQAVKDVGLPAIVLWPNADAGSDDVARGIREFRELGLADKMYFFKNLPLNAYVQLMRNTSCLVGNSSSGIREGAFIGTPAVNIGSRQAGRESVSNVISVPHDRKAIKNAIEKQIKHGPYARNTIYGDGKAGKRIADILAKAEFSLQKKMHYEEI